MSQADGTRKIKGTPVRCRWEWYQEHNGMPTGATLFVWLPDKRATWVEKQAEQGRARRQPAVVNRRFRASLHATLPA